MELEELRNSWKVLNKRLDESEIVNHRIVKEMITQKTKSAFDRIYGLNIYNVVVIFLIAAVLFPWIYMQTPIMPVSFVMVEALMIIGLLFQCRRVYLLSLFDMEQKSSSQLMGIALKYKKAYYGDYKWSIPAVCIVMIAFYISELGYNDNAGYEMGTKLLLPLGLSLLTCAFGYVFALWQHRRHAKQLQEVERGLQELKEFEA